MINHRTPLIIMLIMTLSAFSVSAFSDNDTLPPAFTVEMWFNSSDASGTQLWGRNHFLFSSDWITLREAGADGIQVFAQADSEPGPTIQAQDVGAAIADGLWHHLAMTWELTGTTANVQTYKDGVLLAGDNYTYVTGTFSSIYAMWLGIGYQNDGSPYPGGSGTMYIDEFAFSPYVKNASDFNLTDAFDETGANPGAEIVFNFDGDTTDYATVNDGVSTNATPHESEAYVSSPFGQAIVLNTTNYLWFAGYAPDYVIPACSDGADNDADGLTDFPADPGCINSTDTDELGTNECDDGIDNDLDGFTDYSGGDLGCASQAALNETGQCQDGADNDADGAIDFPTDIACSDANDNDESDVLAQCQDTVDNDGDSATDYPNDDDCSTTQDQSEVGSVQSQCSNTVDDDSDGLIDFPADPDCVDALDNLEATVGGGGTPTGAATGVIGDFDSIAGALLILVTLITVLGAIGIKMRYGGKR